MKMGYIIPLTPLVVEFTRKRGRYEFPHETSHMIRVKDIRRHMEEKKATTSKIAATIGYSFLDNLNTLRNVVSTNTQGKEELTISTVNQFDDRIDQFWNKVKNSYDFVVERKKPWLNWRYADPRAGQYIIKIAEKDGEIKGYIVLELRQQNDYVEGYITDLLTTPKEPTIIEALVQESLKFFDELEINAVHSRVVKGNPQQTALRKCGFIDAPLAKPLIIFINWFDDQGEKDHLNVSSPEKIHFSYGDYF